MPPPPKPPPLETRNTVHVANQFSSTDHPGRRALHRAYILHTLEQLGGSPNFSPEGILTRSHSEYVEGTTLLDMIKEDLIAERVAIDSYTEMIRYIGDDDITTRRVLEGILAVEEEHADDLAGFLADIENRERPSG